MKRGGEQRGGQAFAGHVAHRQVEFAFRGAVVIQIVAAQTARGAPCGIVFKPGNKGPGDGENSILNLARGVDFPILRLECAEARAAAAEKTRKDEC